MRVSRKDNKMIGALPYKTKQFFNFLIKLSVVVGASYYIYNRLVNESQIEFSDFIQFLIEKGVFSVKNGLFLIILTVFNQFFEILKWRKLVEILKNISVFRAAKETFSALISSLFTPNRIGGYATKAALYSKGERKKILLINLLNHMSQMTITVIAGIIGLTFFVLEFDPSIPYFRIARIAFVLLVVGFIGYAGVKQTRFRIRGFEPEKVKDFIRNFPRSNIYQALGFSLIRYLIFSFQFIFIVRLFGFNLDYMDGMIALSSMYFIASIIPALQLFDAVIKGSVALYLFTFLRVPDLIIISTTLLIWILNFALPAVVGAFYIIGHRTSKPIKSIRG